MTTWPEAVLWIIVGGVLRSVPRIVRVLWLHRRSDYLSISGRERRQAWIREGHL